MLNTSLLLLLALGSAASLRENNMTEMSAMMYLTRYGYMDAAAEKMNVSAMDVSEDMMTMAVEEFQSFMNISITGDLDEDTMAMMHLPRCGMKDMIGETRSSRRKRYAIPDKRLPKSYLTYIITNYPKGLSRRKVDDELKRAFNTWSQYVPLSFHANKKSEYKVDIKVLFTQRAHGDSYPFDGPGGELGHATYPVRRGDSVVHFDDDEHWSTSAEGQNLYQVALHELGHTLGLKHSSDNTTVMFPAVLFSNPHVKLLKEDIQGAQKLYGPRLGKLTNDITKMTSPPTTVDKELCRDPAVDTIFLNMQGGMIAFKGDKYYLLTDAGVVVGYPRDISTTWAELPSHIDAATSYRDGKTYFFKGSQLWRYNDTTLDPGFPKQISQMFPGIPDSVNAVMEWNEDGLMYFVKGSEFWALDPILSRPLNEKYPLPLSDWGVPSDINAAFVYKDKTFFFKRDKFYGLDNADFEVDTEDPRYSRNTRHYWFGCTGNSGGNGAETEVGSSSGSGVEKINACVLLAALLALSRNVY